MKITLLCDSTALPRENGSGRLSYESTYPYLLDRKLKDRFGADAPVIVERAKPQRTIDEVLRDWHEEVTLKRPDLVVVQVGLNDCMPRVLLPRERRLLARLPFRRLRSTVARLERRYRPALLRLLPHRVTIPANRFRHKLDEVVYRAGQHSVASLVFVTILPVTRTAASQKHHGLSGNVDLYNQVLRQQAGNPGVHVIDVSDLARREGGPEKFTADGLHLNEAGHEALAMALETRAIAMMEKNMVRSKVRVVR